VKTDGPLHSKRERAETEQERKKEKETSCLTRTFSVVSRSLGGSVEFLLDSGANEHMLCSREQIKTLSNRKTKIFTATGSGENTQGVFGEPKPLIFNH